MVNLLLAFAIAQSNQGRLPNAQELRLLENIRTGNVKALRSAIPNPVQFRSSWGIPVEKFETLMKERYSKSLRPSFDYITLVQTATLNLRSSPSRSRKLLRILGKHLLPRNQEPETAIDHRAFYFKLPDGRELIQCTPNGHESWDYWIETQKNRSVRLVRVEAYNASASFEYDSFEKRVN